MPWTPRGTAALVIALCLVVGTGRARAQADAEGKKAAMKALASGDKKLARGDKLMKKGQMEEALEEYDGALDDYNAAYTAFPDAQIYFPIAQAEQRLGRFVDSLHHYEQVLTSDKIAPELRAQVRINLEQVKRNLSALVFQVEPDGATIAVDGNPIGKSPLEGAHYVEPGKHKLTISADGYGPSEAQVDLAPGKQLTQEVKLERLRVAVKPDGERHPAIVAPPPHGPPSWPLWTGIAGTGVLAIAASWTGAYAVSKHSDFEDPALSGTARALSRTKGRHLALAADLLWGSALIAGGVTAYYYFQIYRKGGLAHEEAAATPDRHALWVAPYLEPDQGGLAVAGQF